MTDERYDFPVEFGKVREFSRATRHRGHRPWAPPTFLTSARLTWEPQMPQSPARVLDFDQARTLHGEEEYVFHGPPPTVGTHLTVTTRLGETWERPGRRGGTMRFGQIVNEFFNRDYGTHVATQTTTVIETGTTR